MKNCRGFTLVELLVVIVIVAILGVVGMTLFSSVNDRAEDAKRKADINAIAKAYEANYAPLAGYTALADSQFADGKIPTSPEGGSYYVDLVSGGGFRVCTAINGGSNPCNANSETCYCKDSTQVTYVASASPLPSPSSLPSVAPSPSPSPSLSPSPSPALGPNLLVNGSFETITGATPTNWQARTEMATDTVEFFEGVRSAKLTGAGSNYTFQNINSLTPGTVYAYSYRVKTQNVAAGVNKGVRGRFIMGATVVNENYITDTGGGWQLVSGNVTMPVGVTGLRFDLQYNLSAGEFAWFDDLYLQQVN